MRPFWLAEAQKESFSCTLQKTHRQGKLSMDYSTLPQPLTQMEEAPTHRAFPF